MMPDYNPNVEFYKKNLGQGAVIFGSMSDRRPNINKNYNADRTFYTQLSNTASIEHRPKLKREKPPKRSEEEIFGSNAAPDSPNLSRQTTC